MSAQNEDEDKKPWMKITLFSVLSGVPLSPSLPAKSAQLKVISQLKQPNLWILCRFTVD